MWRVSDSPLLVETGSGGTITSVGISWVEMQCGGGHFIAQHRVCSSLPTRTGIGRLALLPYALAVNHRQLLRQRMLVLIFTSSPSCALDQRPTTGFETAPNRFTSSGAPATLKMKLVGTGSEYRYQQFSAYRHCLMTSHVDDRIFKCRFALPCCFVK